MKPRLSALVTFLSATCLAFLVSSCGPPKATDAEVVLANIKSHYGKRVVMRAKFRSGARCHQKAEVGKWQTYCVDCQVCRGPIVVDTGKPVDETVELPDWPMILGGTYKGRDIRCKGALNAVECWPFVEGKTYIVQGELESQQPPKLLVERFWEVEEGT